MSYKVKASWWRDDKFWLIDKEADAKRDAEVLVSCARRMSPQYDSGTVEVTHGKTLIARLEVKPEDGGGR